MSENLYFIFQKIHKNMIKIILFSEFQLLKKPILM